ncbi:MAG TPA: hypothetical protein ENH29_10960 [Bacteroidetes bacterium]|nr:hypothetical protein [Bacteroidota bacterium]
MGISFLFILAGYILSILGVDYLIQFILNRLLNLEEDDELKNRIRSGMKTVGRYIGWTERFLIFTMILVGTYSGIGFILAAKSLLRMGNFSSEISEKKFSEYVIFGTLLSFSLAFFLALVVRKLLHLPVQMKIN